MTAASRVLHVVDPGALGGGPCTLRLAAAFIHGTPELSHEAYVLGGHAQRRTALRCGVPLCEAIGLPGGWSGWSVGAGRRLARVLKARRFENAGAPGGGLSGGQRPREGRTTGDGVTFQPSARRTVVLAWSWRAFLVGHALGPDTDQLVAWLALQPTTGPRLRLPLTWTGQPRTHVAGMSNTIDACRSRLSGDSSLVAGRDLRFINVPPAACIDAVRPDLRSAPDLGRDHDARARLRARWGASPEECVVALAADPPERGDSRLASYASAIACVTGRRYRLLLHPQAHAAVRWSRWARSTGLMGAVSAEPLTAEPWRIAAGVDVALSAAEAREPDGSLDMASRRAAHGVLPLLEYMARGVPVIAERTPAASEVIEDGRSGLLVPPDDRVAVAKALLAVRDDEALRSTLIDGGRRRVGERFALPAFIAALRRCVEESRPG